ncbi:MAG: class I SAM-dependent methyltransferase [Saprospiraceae bacterium]|nr:class I SAM-dependent methyltransferase [Saprospiraceae bacterium]
MEGFDRKAHWENIYETRPLDTVSWYQPKPETSLRYFKALATRKDARILDVGGGDSFLVDHLLDEGYSDITILDISEKGIERAKARLGDRAEKITWINSDITNFEPEGQYDLWHDRAAFHFLNSEEEIQKYLEIASKAIRPGGNLVLGTFSTEGPTKCSGIEIRQYSPGSMIELFGKNFFNVGYQTIDHKTPKGGLQNFVFCSFQRLRD